MFLSIVIILILFIIIIITIIIIIISIIIISSIILLVVVVVLLLFLLLLYNHTHTSRHACFCNRFEFPHRREDIVRISTQYYYYMFSWSRDDTNYSLLIGSNLVNMSALRSCYGPEAKSLQEMQ